MQFWCGSILHYSTTSILSKYVFTEKSSPSVSEVSSSLPSDSGSKHSFPSSNKLSLIVSQLKSIVPASSPAAVFNTRNYTVFIDDHKRNFTVARKLDVNENPDIVPLSAIVQCRVEVDRQQIEKTYTKDGKTVSYQPPIYDYEFDYTMRIKVNTPWFDDMDFRLNTFSISSEKRGELMEVEQTGHQIIAALTQNDAGIQPGTSMNTGMQPGMSMNAGMRPGMNMNPGMQPDSGSWRCQCGAENVGRFCEYCGQPRPF